VEVLEIFISEKQHFIYKGRVNTISLSVMIHFISYHTFTFALLSVRSWSFA